MSRIKIRKESFDRLMKHIINEQSEGQAEYQVHHKGKPFSKHNVEENANIVRDMVNRGASKEQIDEEMNKHNQTENCYSKRIEEESINEVSPELFKRAGEKMVSKGQEWRAYNLGKTYLNQFIGKSMLGNYKIYDLGYAEDITGPSIIVNIKDDAALSNDIRLVYDIKSDIWVGFGDKPINRTDARILSLIAKKINPNSKYGNGVGDFKIKGY